MIKRARDAQDTNDVEATRPSQPPPALAANVRRLRERSGLSPEQLAQATGLAPDTVSKLEAGAHEPTIKTLWSLATALQVPFSALIAPESKDAEKSTRTKNVRARKVLSSKEHGRNSEVFELKLAAQAVEVAPPRRAGSLENVLVTDGIASITTGTTKLTLRTGESASFAADSERTYASVNGAAATLYIVASQPAS